MPAAALAFVLSAAVVHAIWNLLLARARAPEAATAVALVVAVVPFAPVAVVLWDVDARVWPFVAVTSCLQLAYFLLLATAYRRAELSLVYPVARGSAPVLVLLVGVVALGAGTSLAQALGVSLVAAGVVLVPGLGRDIDRVGVGFGLAIAVCIAAYTLVDKHGIRYAGPIVYLELGMVPASLAYAGVVARKAGVAELRRAFGPSSVAAGLGTFAAYALVLAALARAPAAPVAAVRETSILFAAALARVVLVELVGASRLAGAVLVVGGVALLGL